MPLDRLSNLLLKRFVLLFALNGFSDLFSDIAFFSVSCSIILLGIGLSASTASIALLCVPLDRFCYLLLKRLLLFFAFDCLSNLFSDVTLFSVCSIILLGICVNLSRSISLFLFLLFFTGPWSAPVIETPLDRFSDALSQRLIRLFGAAANMLKSNGLNSTSTAEFGISVSLRLSCRLSISLR